MAPPRSRWTKVSRSNLDMVLDDSTVSVLSEFSAATTKLLAEAHGGHVTTVRDGLMKLKTKLIQRDYQQGANNECRLLGHTAPH